MGSRDRHNNEAQSAEPGDRLTPHFRASLNKRRARAQSQRNPGQSLVTLLYTRARAHKLPDRLRGNIKSDVTDFQVSSLSLAHCFFGGGFARRCVHAALPTSTISVRSSPHTETTQKTKRRQQVLQQRPPAPPPPAAMAEIPPQLRCPLRAPGSSSACLLEERPPPHHHTTPPSPAHAQWGMMNSWMRPPDVRSRLV